MQFHVEREAIRRHRAPALHHSRFRRRIERRVYLDQIEMLRIPRQSLAGRQFLRIPTLHKTRVRPTRGADKNFPAHLVNEVAVALKANATRNKATRGRARTPKASRNRKAISCGFRTKCFGVRCVLASLWNHLLCQEHASVGTSVRYATNSGSTCREEKLVAGAGFEPAIPPQRRDYESDERCTPVR
jgi:hypothetical protein